MAKHESEGHALIRIEGESGGFVQYCSGCERVSLRWGNLMIPLELPRFQAFCDFLAETCERHFAQADAQEASELRFRFSELYLCFSPAEAEALLSLARRACTEIFRSRFEHAYGLESPVG